MSKIITGVIWSFLTLAAWAEDRQPPVPGLLMAPTHITNLDSLDTGQFNAIIQSDPQDRRKSRGIIHLSRVHSARITARENPQALSALVEAINEYTLIRADIGGLEGLSSRAILSMPWIFLDQVNTEFTGSELRNLGRYMVQGGFVFADAGQVIGGEPDMHIRLNIKKALAKAGKRARFKRLRAGHAIHHAFFQFDQPPPVPLESSGTGRDNVDYLIGVSVDGRLAAVLGYQGFGAAWENATNSIDNTRHLHFGINTLFYALFREMR